MTNEMPIAKRRYKNKSKKQNPYSSLKSGAEDESYEQENSEGKYQML